MKYEEKTLKKNYIFKGNIINVRKDDVLSFDQKPCTREVIEHPGGVSIIAFNENDEIFLVNQYRYPFGKMMLELPAGKLEKGEDPLDCARRELEEEQDMRPKASNYLT